MSKPGDNMELEAGKREMLQIFEDNTTRNVTAVVEYSKETRAIVRKFEEELLAAHNRITMLEDTIKQIKTQLVNMQIKVYAGGS